MCILHLLTFCPINAIHSSRRARVLENVSDVTDKVGVFKRLLILSSSSK